MSKRVIAAFVAAAIVSIFAAAGCGDDTGGSGSCTKAEDCSPLTCNGTEFRGCVNGACITNCDGST